MSIRRYMYHGIRYKEKSYGEILGWIKARLSFAVIRATDLCLRGSRVRWRSGTGIDDGAGLPTVMPVLH